MQSPVTNNSQTDGGSVSISKRQGIIVASIPGEFTVTNRQELKQKMLDALEHGERTFLIDLGQTGYIDTSALGALLSLSKRIQSTGGSLRLTNLNEDLRSLFALTRLDSLFEIAGDGDPLIADSARPEGGESS